jgi:predicted Zn-dependent peptidase
MANWLCHHQLLTGQIRTVEQVVAIIDAISPADLRRVAKRVLDAPVQMAVIGPFKDDSRFRKLV